MVAVKAGRQKIVEILIEAEADVNACRRVKSPGWSVLHAATFAGDTQIVKLLLDKGAKITESLWYTSFTKSRENGRCSRMHSACSCAGKGNEEMVKTLIHAGDNPNQVLSDGTNALHYAALNPNPAVGILLIKEYKVNLNQRAENGKTPFFLVKNSSLIACFLENGAEVDVVDEDGWSRLYWECFCIKNNPEIIILLLNHGANHKLKLMR